MRAGVQRFALPDPGDVSGLSVAIDVGDIDPKTIVAVIGKTHGNGLVNDYTRGYLTLSLALLISSRTGETPEAVRKRVPFIFSGGVEGVLSPHYSVFTVNEDMAAPVSGRKALAIGVAFTPELKLEDIGRKRMIELTAAAVRDAMSKASITNPKDVHFVQTKSPAFTMSDIVEANGRGAAPTSDNPGKLMGSARAASALGIGIALGEIDPAKAIDGAVGNDFSLFSSVASSSAGTEVRVNEVIVVGMSDRWSGSLAIAHSPLADPLDTAGIRKAVADLGFPDTAQLSSADAASIRAAFVKCEAPRDGKVRGKSNTMLNDGDIDQQRHIRAAVGAIVASVINDTAIFVSGGAEHQGPDGGGVIALIAERRD